MINRHGIWHCRPGRLYSFVRKRSMKHESMHFRQAYDCQSIRHDDACRQKPWESIITPLLFREPRSSAALRDLPSILWLYHARPVCPCFAIAMPNHISIEPSAEPSYGYTHDNAQISCEAWNAAWRASAIIRALRYRSGRRDSKRPIIDEESMMHVEGIFILCMKSSAELRKAISPHSSAGRCQKGGIVNRYISHGIFAATLGKIDGIISSI